MRQVKLWGNSYFKELSNKEGQVFRSHRCHCTLKEIISKVSSSLYWPLFPVNQDGILNLLRAGQVVDRWPTLVVVKLCVCLACIGRLITKSSFMERARNDCVFPYNHQTISPHLYHRSVNPGWKNIWHHVFQLVPSWRGMLKTAIT